MQNIQELLKQNPELLEVSALIKQGIITPEEGMEKFKHLLANTPGLENLNVEVTIKPDQKLQVPNQVIQNPGKLPQINPLFTAAVAERLQFDNDIPELRSGLFDLNATPAVGVETDCRSSVAIGLMMKDAETKLKSEIIEHENQRLDAISKIAEGKLDSSDMALVKMHTDLVAKGTEDSFAIMKRGNAETDLPSYRRGEVAKPMMVSSPTGSELLNTSKDDRQSAAHKFLTSTQGRRSAVTTIRQIILEEFRAKGITLSWQNVDPQTHNILVSHKWVSDISGPHELNERFSIINLAAKSLAIKLLKDFQPSFKDAVLEVTPVNNLSNREIGWSAFIKGSKPLKVEHCD